MLTRKLLGTSLCVAAFGFGAVRLQGDTVMLPESSAQCADGSCVPRRLTNGYYPTKWRKWPVEPPAKAQPGIREAIPSPPLELPDPKTEIDLPESAFGPPPGPSDQGGAPGYDTPQPGGAGPTTMPRGQGGPSSAPQPNLPPELRYEMPLPRPDDRTPDFPSDQRTPRRTPAIALRGGNRPAAVVEALRNEARSAALDRSHGEPHMPRALPSDQGHAEPLPQAPPVEAPSIQPAEPSIRRDAPLIQPSARAFQSREQPIRTGHQRAGWVQHAAAAGGRTQWSPARGTQQSGDRQLVTNEFAVRAAAVQSARERTDDGSEVDLRRRPRTASIGEIANARGSLTRTAAWQPDAWQRDAQEVLATDDVAASPSPRPIRPATAGLNTPAVVPSRLAASEAASELPRSAASDLRRTPVVADLTISPPSSAAVLAVRTASDERWRDGAPVQNPLRRGSGVAKVVFETDAATSDEAEPADADTPSARRSAALEIDVPANPLR